MLRRAGYDPSPYQAGAPLEVERMMKKREDIGEAQRAAWLKKVLDEREKLPLALREAAKKLEL
jgi:hypothetical protein